MGTKMTTIGARGAAGVLGVAAMVALPSAAAAASTAHGADHGAGHGKASAQRADADGAGSSGGQAPAGNNGTIKVDGYTMDPGQDNDAHVACGFSVSFFGYDAGSQHASITVTPWSPTAGGHPATYTTSWTTPSRTGGNQFDANYQVSAADVAAIFSGVAPAHQGYHARIEAEVSGSRGSDDKFKMVWIKPCSNTAPTAGSGVAGSTTPGTTSGPTSGSTTAPSTGGTTTGAATGASLTAPPAAIPSAATPSGAPGTATGTGAAGTATASGTGRPTVGTAVLGETISRPPTTPAGTTGSAVAGETLAAAPAGSAAAATGSLPFTGADIAAETAVGLGLVAAGLALVRRRRTPRPTA